MTDSFPNAVPASTFKRTGSRFVQNTLPKGESSDELTDALMEQLRQDPNNQALAESCFLAVLAKATKEAIQHTRGRTYLPGLTVELVNGDLDREVALDATVKVMQGLKQGLHRNGGYVQTMVARMFNRKRETAANRARIEQEKWLPLQVDQTRAPEFDSSDFDALREQIAELPGKVRSAVTMHFLDGLPVASVATQLGVSVRTAYRLKDQGLELLRAAMGG